jgi:hypothetical protein
MIEVRLDMEEWQRVLGILAQAPWATANPLIMKVADQLRIAQSERDAYAAKRPDGEEIRTPDRH